MKIFIITDLEGVAGVLDFETYGAFTAACITKEHAGS